MMTSKITVLRRHLFGRNSVWAVLPLVVALLASAYINIAYNKTVRTTRSLVSHSLRVNNAIFELLSALQDVETGQRGFLITGDPAYLEPFEQGTRKIEPLIGRLQHLVSDNRIQTSQLKAISALARFKAQETARTVRVRQEEGFDQARLIVASNDGKRTMDDVRAAIGEMRATEQTLLTERIDAMKIADRNLVYVAVASIVLALLGRLLAMMVQINQRKRRRERSLQSP
jgi:methyl-accepting chemotaxis protein